MTLELGDYISEHRDVDVYYRYYDILCNCILMLHLNTLLTSPNVRTCTLIYFTKYCPIPDT